ncbi:MAG: helix-turn-helix transcriptional regulator, partial [Chloroflexota bacterium]
MSSFDSFNFGRKIKELKKVNKKGYADLTAGLKISRERIIQLEENEREPSETERRRFAAFYNLPPEEFGVGSSPTPPAPARPAPGNSTYIAGPTGSKPSYDNSQERQGGGSQNDRRPSNYVGSGPSVGQRPNPSGPSVGQRPNPSGPSVGQRP